MRCPKCKFHPMSHTKDGNCLPLEERMKRADWYWHYSDDPNVRKDGEDQIRVIKLDLSILAANDPDAARQLWKTYGPEPWNST